MTNKNIAEAKKWCEEARKLLKIKAKIGYDDSVDSKELYDARKKVENQIEVLKKELKNKVGNEKSIREKKIEAYENEYIRLAEIAKLAAKENNLELARTVTSQFQLLAATMVAKDQGEIDKANEMMLSKVQAQYELALKSAEGMQSLLVEKNETPHDFLGTIPNLISHAKTEAQRAESLSPSEKVEILQRSIRDLGAVEGVYKVQLLKHSQYLTFKQKLAELHLEVEMVKASLTKNLGVENGNLSLAQSAIRNATSQVDAPKFEYLPALKTLELAHEECKKAKKNESFDSKVFSKIEDGHKKFTKKVIEFEGLYRVSNELYLKSGSLFGVVTNLGEVVGAREIAKDCLTEGRTSADQSIKGFECNPSEFEAHLLLLSSAKKLIQQVSDVEIPKAIKASDEAKKQVKEKGGHHVAEWQDLLRKAQNSLEEMRGFKDVADLKLQLEDLIETASALTATKEERRDYPTAISKLNGYEELFKTALSKQEGVKGGLPGVDSGKEFSLEYNALKLELNTSAHLQESYFRPSYLSEMNTIADGLSINEPFALQQIKALRSRLDKDLLSLINQYDDALKSKHAFEMELVSYSKVPNEVVESAMQYAFIAGSRMNKHAWLDAKNDYEQALMALKNLESQKSSLDELGQKWREKDQKLSEMMKFANSTVNWRPLTETARNLINSIQEARQALPIEYNYEEFFNAFTSIEEKYQELEKLAEEQHLPGDPELLKKFVDFYKQGRDLCEKNVENSRRKAESATVAFERQLTNLEDVGENPFRIRLRKIDESWSSQVDLKSANLPDLSNLSEKEVFEKIQAELFGKLQELQIKIIGDYDTLVSALGEVNISELQKTLEKEQEEKIKNNPALQISKLLSILINLGIDVSKYNQRSAEILLLTDENVRTQDTKKLAEELALLVEQSKQKHEEIKKKCEEKSKKGKEVIGKVGEILQSNYLKFQSAGVFWVTSYDEFKKTLEKQLKDVESLLNSDDPDLVDLANEQLKDAFENIKKVTPDASPSFTDVHKRHKFLAQQLGVDSDRIVIKYLKDTHARLSKKLDDAFVVAQKSSPEKGLEALSKDLENEILAAIEKAKQRKAEREKYEEKKDRIIEQWTEIKKQTKTWVTERTAAFAKYFDSSIESAESQRKAENGGIEKANKTLDDLQKKLEDIQNSKDPRTTLIELDSKLATDQRTVKEMGRQFGEEVKVFKETRIKLVSDAFDKKASLKTTEKEKKIELKEGKKVTNGMKKRVGEAKKMVSKMSDDPETAKRQLLAARNVLREQEEFASRMLGQTQTTNVNITKNLPAVHKNWQDKVEFYVNSINAFASKVENLSIDGEQKIDPQQAKNAGSVIRSLAGQFPRSAFDRPMAILKDSKDPVERRTAREEALLIMRTHRGNLLGNPVIKRLANNPVDRDTMMASLGYLRHALKSIEMEVLVGV